MGTHRSRHNKGRKPLYKEKRDRTDWKRDPRLPGVYTSPAAWNEYLGHLATMSTITASKLPGMPSRAAFAKKRQHDLAFDAIASQIIAGRSLQANSGRVPIAEATWKAVAAKASLHSPEAISIEPGMPSVAAIYKRRRVDADFNAIFLRRQRPITLAYPYIVSRRSEHADVLEVNSLVPKSFSGDRRADICQEILLALLEGRTTMEQLRARRDDANFFIKKFWRDNFEMSGHAVSLDSTVGDSDQTYYQVASSIAAKEWHFGTMNDRRSARDALATFHPPTQIEDAFIGQVRRKWIAMQEDALRSGDMRDMLSFEEVYDLMEAS